MAALIALIVVLLAALAAAVAGLQAERRLGAAQARTAEEKLALVRGERDAFRQEMQAISGQVLSGATAQLAKLADEARRADQAAAAGELGRRATEITGAIAPIAEHLGKVQASVDRLERERHATHATVRQLFERTTSELDRLRVETGALVSALKRPQVRGSWGEIQLKNVARIAGMTDHVDFHTQVSVAGETGRLRPDMTVHLPTGRDIVVDSKVPLDAYLSALEAKDDDERDRCLARHAAQLRAHLDALAGKAYHAKLERSAEFVVCFVPNEACYVAALDRDPALLEHGAGKGVLIATPTTLLALLHATHYGWRQAEVEESAQVIAAAGRELHRRCATFLDAYAKVGRQLTSATEAYNSSIGSLEARVLPQLRRFEELGAGSEKTLAAPKPIDSVARTMMAG